MEYLFVLLVLAAGYFMGLGSRFVIKKALDDYIDTRMKDLNSVTSSYTNKVQIQCDKLVEEAQDKAIDIYKEALTEVAEVILRPEPKNLN